MSKDPYRRARDPYGGRKPGGEDIPWKLILGYIVMLLFVAVVGVAIITLLV